MIELPICAVVLWLIGTAMVTVSAFMARLHNAELEEQVRNARADAWDRLTRELGKR